MEKQNAFKGDFAADYRLHLQAFPVREAMQGKLGEEVTRIVGDSSGLALEIGTGTGRTAYNVLTRTQNLRIVGVDDSADMLIQARENLADYASRIQLVNADALTFLREREQAYKVGAVQLADLTFTGLTLHNLQRTKRKAVLQGIYQNLREGASFVSFDLAYPDDTVERKAQMERTLESLGIYASMGRPDLTAKWRAHALEDFADDVLLIKGQFEQDMYEAGFEKVSCISYLDRYAFHVAQKIVGDAK